MLSLNLCFEAVLVWLYCCICRRSAKALYDCQAEDELELSFKKDEVLYNGEPTLYMHQSDEAYFYLK